MTIDGNGAARAVRSRRTRSLRNALPAVPAPGLRLDRAAGPRPGRGGGPHSRLAAAPTEPVLDREQREAIARAFGMLPTSLRAAATLALIEEQPYVDIADALG